MFVQGCFAGTLDSISVIELHATFGKSDGSLNTRHLSTMLQVLWVHTASAFGAMASSAMLGVCVGAEHGQHSARDASAGELQGALARSFCQVYLLVTLFLSVVAVAFAIVTVQQK